MKLKPPSKLDRQRPSDLSQTPRMRQLVSELESKYSLPPGTLTSYRREQHVSRARQELFYTLMSDGLSSSEIGKRLGFCHSAVLHGAGRYAQDHDVPAVTGIKLNKRVVKSHPAEAVAAG